MKNKLKKHMLENGQTTFKKSKDGKNLRIAFWKAKKVKAYGTVFFLNGHREFIEKYLETFQFFLKKGFLDSNILDWLIRNSAQTYPFEMIFSIDD